MPDPLTQAPELPTPTYLQGDALASALVGLQDELKTGKVQFQCIDGDGYICLLFGGLVSARFQGEVGGEAVVSMLAAPPGKIEIENVFEMPEGQELAAPSVSLAELVDRWRKTATAPILEADDEDDLESISTSEPANIGPEVTAVSMGPAPLEPDAGLGDSPFDVGPDEEAVAVSSPRPFAVTAQPGIELDDPLAYGAALFDPYGFGDDEETGPSINDSHDPATGAEGHDVGTDPLPPRQETDVAPSGGLTPPRRLEAPHEAGPEANTPFSQPTLPPVLAATEPLFLPLPAGLPLEPSFSPCPPEFVSGEQVHVWVERERFTGVLSFGAPETLRLYTVQGRVLGVETLVDGHLSIGPPAAHVGALSMHGRRVVALRYETGLATALASMASWANLTRDGVRTSYPCRDVSWTTVQSTSPDQLAMLALSAGHVRMVAWRAPGSKWQSAAAGGTPMLDLADLEAAWQFDQAGFSCQYLDPQRLRPLFESTLPAQVEPLKTIVPSAPHGKRNRLFRKLSARQHGA